MATDDNLVPQLLDGGWSSSGNRYRAPGQAGWVVGADRLRLGPRARRCWRTEPVCLDGWWLTVGALVGTVCRPCPRRR